MSSLLKPLRPPRILLDISTSVSWRGRHAVGIVRTEREIAARLLDDAAINVIPVVFQDGTLRAIDPVVARRIVAPVPPSKPLSLAESASATPVAAEILDSARSPIRTGYFAVTGCARFAARGLIRIIPFRSREDFRLSLLYAREALRHLFFSQPSTSAPVAVAAVSSMVEPHANEDAIDLSLFVTPNANDVMFIGGLGWDVINCKALSILKRDCGFRIASVSYDLIPSKFPEYLGGDNLDYFINYFLSMIDLSDYVFCISLCTQRDLVEFCVAEGRSTPETGILYLGSNVPSPADPGELDDLGLREKFESGRFALTVGTFEIRKNYKLLIKIWHEMVEDPAFDLDLVIVGMPGWNVDEIIKGLEESPLYGTRIFWFRKLSDAGLSWLYDKCHVFVFPSLYEGWGLPVVEALLHRRPAIISSLGATPEAGMGLATVIDPADEAEWIRQIKRSALAPRQSITLNSDLPTWDLTGDFVKDVMLRLQPQPQVDGAL
jgi:glycosyltransferase involved in cell wall biosynthesis